MKNEAYVKIFKINMLENIAQSGAHLRPIAYN